MADSSTLVDRVKIFVESSGTGPFQLGNPLPAFRGSEALVDGLTYSYAVESGSDYEVGQGVYVLAVDQLIRAPTLSSNGGAPVSFPANVAINFTALAADLVAGLAGSGTVTSIQGSGGTTGLTLTGGPITGAGTLTLGGVLGVANGGTGGTTAAEARTGIGLGNVDNTSDANKPVSTATQTALNAKASLTDLAATTGAGLVGFRQTGTAAVSMTLSKVSARIFHATDLGALADDSGDDGAILTAAIQARFGTLASSQSQQPVRIEFGDSRYIYRLATPIVVQQNYIELVANGAVLNCQSSAQAIRYDYDGSANIVFGALVSGFTLRGTITGDGILVKSGSQCCVTNIINKAAVSSAVVHFTGTIASWTDNVRHDNEVTGSTTYVILETALEKTPGNFFACIANRHVGTLAYSCSGSGIFLDESDGFVIEGSDIEKSGGPGVDLLNCRFGYVDVYTEINGQTATNVGTDTPDDIRIRSGAGAIVSRSANITISGTRCAGQPVGGVTPNNVHIIGGDDCLVVENNFGGNLKIESGCARNNFGVQTRFIGTLTDAGSYTIDRSTAGKQTFNVTSGTRLEIDAYAAGGAKIGSPQALLRFYGISSFGPGTTAGSNLAGFVTVVDANTTGSVTFGTPEPDAEYIVFLDLWDVSGGSATWSVKLTGRNGAGFTFDLDAAPGAGKTVRVHWMIVRVG